MTYVEYQQRLKVPVGQMVKLLHKREIECVLLKNEEVAKAMGTEIESLVSEIFKLQDIMLGQEMTAEDLLELIKTVKG